MTSRSGIYGTENAFRGGEHLWPKEGPAVHIMVVETCEQLQAYLVVAPASAERTSNSSASMPRVPMTLMTLRMNDCCAERQPRNEIMRLSTLEGTVPSRTLNTFMLS